MKKADSEFIKGRIAPCGLHCGKCFAFADGDISYHSNELKRSLGNFDVYAQRFVAMLDEPVFAKYPDFKEFLDRSKFLFRRTGFCLLPYWRTSAVRR